MAKTLLSLVAALGFAAAIPDLSHRQLQRQGGGAGGGRPGGRGQKCDYQSLAEMLPALGACSSDASLQLTLNTLDTAVCDNRCARELLPIFRECSSTLGADALLPLAALNTACESALSPTANSRPGGGAGFGLGARARTALDARRNPGGGPVAGGAFNPSPPSDTASCSSADVLPVILACSSFLTPGGAVAITGASLGSADGFCQSKCHDQLGSLFTSCGDRMAADLQAMVQPLLGFQTACLSAVPVDAVATQLTDSRCPVAEIAAACGISSGLSADGSVECSPACAAIMDRAAKGCAKAPEFKPFESMMDVCSDKTTGDQCAKSMDGFVSFITGSCCADDADACAGGMPKECTPECADVFLPYFSRCGRTVFAADQSQLRDLEQFDRTCAGAAGRNVWTGAQAGAALGGRAQLMGPDANDVCSATTDCGACSGTCGWCKDEVTSKRALRRHAGGWCSSECVTTDGECPAATGK